MKLFFTISGSILFLTIAKPAFSQKTWYVGIHIGTGYYQLYNKNDWNADPILISPVKGKPTNWTAGATTTYTWGRHWGLSSGLLLSKNRQEFMAEKDPSSPDPLEYYSIKDELQYLKMPVSIQYSTNNDAKQQLVFSGGVQASFLLDYREYFLQKSSGFHSEAEWHNKILRAIATGVDSKYNKFIYSRFLIGLNSTIMYCLGLSNGWKLSLGVKGEYDITNSENRKSKRIETGDYFWNSGVKRYGYGDIKDRPKTHNRAVGVFISASIPVAVH
jgi:hypothetical protein